MELPNFKGIQTMDTPKSIAHYFGSEDARTALIGRRIRLVSGDEKGSGWVRWIAGSVPIGSTGTIRTTNSCQALISWDRPWTIRNKKRGDFAVSVKDGEVSATVELLD